MLYFNNQFQNYAEFQEKFGIQRHGNGAKSRKNKILLAHLKSQSLKEARENNDYSLLEITDMAHLKSQILLKVQQSSLNDDRLPYRLYFMNLSFGSATYATDELNGICEDKDFRQVRVRNIKTGKIVKVKVGKLLKTLIAETEFGKNHVCEQVERWLEEEITADWMTYCMTKFPNNYKLIVDKDFDKIYSSLYYTGNFHSCMADEDNYYMYEDAVDASAARLENDKGKILARAVIFNKVHDEDGKIWRLCERQYAADDSNILKMVLVNELIAGGYIDGYKRVGCACSDNTLFVDIKGNSLSKKQFWIDCELYYDSNVSYMDSFVWYDYGAQKAYNYNPGAYDYRLDVTYGSLEEDDCNTEYDSYHDENVDSVVEVFVHGYSETCNEYNLDDFEYVESLGQYHHKDDVYYCEQCGKYYLGENNCYSTIIDQDFCSKECRDNAEAEFKEHNTYSDYDGYWIPNESIKTYYAYNGEEGRYNEKTISEQSLWAVLDRGIFYKDPLDGKVYDTISPITKRPFICMERYLPVPVISQANCLTY